MRKIIDFILELFGFRQEKSKEQEWLESKVKQKEKELEKIDEENNSPSDNVDYLNK
jgi:hypothetical protein